ncbi:U7 snRNA-associated Sm-like protein LSm11 [Austrofundulus limnaeus]|uniref:U7 snRNA-associated Sm-like protein LSm11 n=1 Tax=Austrofundulus limnaeus TaxID=52670 RepID=A0A2I4BR03_AUSLI|nr:PREDICTED: U7 snRNA-associated Sm-like protein LSm11 [Austrofundulus limnaeus]
MEERERVSDKCGREKAVSRAEHEQEADSTERDDEADTMNVCSERFDPLRALYSSTAPPLPFPNIKCFNNVAEYESHLKGGRGRAKPENVEKRRLKAMKGVADPERIEKLKKLMVNNPVPDSEEGGGSSQPRRRRREKPQRNVLTRMPLCKGSPLGELHRCVQDRIRVKVHIRTFKGLRGVCSGFVVAFDKFWNMAMVDVDETYREPLFGEALHHEKALTVTRLFEKLRLQENPGVADAVKKQEAQGKANEPRETLTSRSDGPDTTEDSGVARSRRSESVPNKPDKGDISQAGQKYGKVRTRHINQLFIRGENVVLVNPQPL